MGDIIVPKAEQRKINTQLPKDAYPKMLIARTRCEEYQYEGIRVVDVADWLTALA